MNRRRRERQQRELDLERLRKLAAIGERTAMLERWALEHDLKVLTLPIRELEVRAWKRGSLWITDLIDDGDGDSTGMGIATVGISYYPPITGRQRELIAYLEALLDSDEIDADHADELRLRLDTVRNEAGIPRATRQAT